jgi:hypothetical protein
MDIEAQVLEIIGRVRDSPYGDGFSIKEIANRLIERHGEDFERKITDHWIGGVVRQKLGLKTERRTKAGYVIAATEAPKLARLFEKYGIVAEVGDRVNLVNSDRDIDPPLQGPVPLIM